jgi:hypothetical protein
MDIIFDLDCFPIDHIYNHDNWLANELAQHTSSYPVSQGMFNTSEQPMFAATNLCMVDLQEAN